MGSQGVVLGIFVEPAKNHLLRLPIGIGRDDEVTLLDQFLVGDHAARVRALKDQFLLLLDRLATGELLKESQLLGDEANRLVVARCLTDRLYYPLLVGYDRELTVTDRPRCRCFRTSSLSGADVGKQAVVFKPGLLSHDAFDLGTVLL